MLIPYYQSWDFEELCLTLYDGICRELWGKIFLPHRCRILIRSGGSAGFRLRILRRRLTSFLFCQLKKTSHIFYSNGRLRHRFTSTVAYMPIRGHSHIYLYLLWYYGGHCLIAICLHVGCGCLCPPLVGSAKAESWKTGRLVRHPTFSYMSINLL